MAKRLPIEKTNNPFQKLSEIDVGEILLRLEAGESRRKLSREFKVAPQRIDYYYHRSKFFTISYSIHLQRATYHRRAGELKSAAEELRTAAAWLEAQ